MVLIVFLFFPSIYTEEYGSDHRDNRLRLLYVDVIIDIYI